MQDTHQNPVLPALLTIAAVALLIGFSESQVRKWTYRQRTLPRGWPTPVRIADSVRYRRADVERWLSELVETAAASPGVSDEAACKTKRRRGRPCKFDAGCGEVA